MWDSPLYLKKKTTFSTDGFAMYFNTDIAIFMSQQILDSPFTSKQFSYFVNKTDFDNLPKEGSKQLTWNEQLVS